MYLFNVVGIILSYFYCLEAMVSSLDNRFGGMKSVCYQFMTQSIRPNDCTHVIYRLVLNDLDIDRVTLDRLVEDSLASRDHNIKVLVQLVLNQPWATLKTLTNSIIRSEFVNGIVNFVRRKKLDGIEMFFVDDRDTLVDFVRDLADEFKKENFLLVIHVKRTYFDVQLLAKTVNWLAIDTFVEFSASKNITGNLSPLYYNPEDENKYKENIDYTINNLIKKGVPPKKIVINVHFYGLLFTLDTKRQRIGLHTPAVPCQSQEATFLDRKCFLTYNELCVRVKKENWTVEQDPVGRVGPYAYKGDQWVSYDDPAMIRRKVKFAKSLGLGGIGRVEIEYDDSNNNCGDGKNPLLRAVTEELMTNSDVPKISNYYPFQVKPVTPAS